VAKHLIDVDNLVGRSLGRRYELVAQIARGGMAIVYRAHDRQLDRVVAVKVPRPEFASDRRFSEQFRREALAAARLSHPNIVAVHDSGEDRGLPWIVMEHVRGQTLRDLLNRVGRLDVETTAELVGGVAEALEHAHQAGIAHLDMKPENVLLTDDAVKVADFGLVRAAHATSDTPLAGTAQYLAPELLNGHAVDGRADVYALGVVAYECLTGRPPFTGDQDTVIGQHLASRVPPPSLVVPGISQDVDAAIWNATEPDPARRYAHATEFAAAMGAPRRRRMSDMLRPAGHAAVPWDTSVDVRLPSRASRGPRPTIGRVPKVRHQRGRSDRSGNRAVAILVVLGVLLVGGGLGLQQLSTQAVAMPRVVGKSQGLAKLELRRRLLRAHVQPARPSASVPAGRIAAQSVPPDRAVHRFTVVELVPSSGITLPSLANADAAAAQAQLERLRLRYRVDQQPSQRVPEGRVIGTSPAAGTAIADQEVQLVVSSGRPKVDVPDVDGISFAQARRRLEARGLAANRVNVFAGGVAPGLVVRTDPASGTTVEQGSTVQVQVSAGSDEVIVPDVRGMKLADALARLRGLGLVPRQLLFGDHVLDQNPGPGGKVRRGSSVVVWRSPV
jgi:eukaryotic-like serine/threonine-protein kinase